MTALDKAIKIAGGIRPLGRAIGAWPSQIHKWANEYNGRVPTGERVRQIYIATGVTPHELRPDLYPNPTDGLPAGDKANTPNTPELIHENQA
ncbi:TPA: helix-turn-helix domain-containing protein [Escherichia coli]|uniref:Helix-turn-helix domain-containing protein n=2 Tax=Escherichia coli TaxID=562 RepID=A0A1X0YV20_ECOLX|nr:MULTISPECIES: YdaS family helix-turn-helix protein [Escherichia]EEZ5887006.1 helix-turn-helix domain-containing protein [Escherichia coli O146]EKK3521856.1 helix-turn-helix domain-containing protein [Escherichia coli O157]MEC9928941.1 YdaS family helix-turn-helix protein [Escherichia marmotae]EEC7408074.1 helix-turn-helix domain-containing protein [Escherichia coli]EEQ9413382.1 helix-turn-helix domain-containing protein [Escherichia coli]